MKITVHSANGHHFVIPLPTALLTSPTVLRFALNTGKKHAGKSVPNIPPEAIQALCQSIRKVKREHGDWELVHVESTAGDHISIIL